MVSFFPYHDSLYMRFMSQTVNERVLSKVLTVADHGENQKRQLCLKKHRYNFLVVKEIKSFCRLNCGIKVLLYKLL